MKNLPWDREKDSETVWHTVKPWELRGLNVLGRWQTDFKSAKEVPRSMKIAETTDTITYSTYLVYLR